MGLLDRPGQPQRFGLLSPDVMNLIASGGPRMAPAPAAPAQPARRGPGFLTYLMEGREGMERERMRPQMEQARAQLEAARQQYLAGVQDPRERALFLGAGSEDWNKNVGEQFAPRTTSAGGRTDIMGTGQSVAAPSYTTVNDTVFRNDPLTGASTANAIAPPAFSEVTDRYEAENPTVAANSRVVNLPSGNVVAEGFRPLEASSVPQGGSLAVTDPQTGAVINSVQGQPERRRSYEDASGVRRFEDDGQAVFPGDEVRVRSQARGRLDAATTSGNLLLAEVDKAIGLTGAGETGVVGAVMGAVPGTRALNLRRTIETIKANVGFNYLQQMRELSPTGGALGSLAVQEMQSLQSVLGNLDPNMGERELEGVLNQVKSIVQQGQSLRERLYSEQFGAGPAPSAPSQGAGAAGPVAEDAQGNRYVVRNGQWVRQ